MYTYNRDVPLRRHSAWEIGKGREGRVEKGQRQGSGPEVGSGSSDAS